MSIGNPGLTSALRGSSVSSHTVKHEIFFSWDIRSYFKRASAGYPHKLPLLCPIFCYTDKATNSFVKICLSIVNVLKACYICGKCIVNVL